MVRDSEQPKREKHFEVGLEPEGPEPDPSIGNRKRKERRGAGIRLDCPPQSAADRWSTSPPSIIPHPPARPTGSAALHRNASVSTARRRRRGMGIRRGRTLASTDAGGKPLLATGREWAEGSGWARGALYPAWQGRFSTWAPPAPGDTWRIYLMVGRTGGWMATWMHGRPPDRPHWPLADPVWAVRRPNSVRCHCHYEEEDLIHQNVMTTLHSYAILATICMEMLKVL
jgi:hypothetical protein